MSSSTHTIVKSAAPIVHPSLQRGNRGRATTRSRGGRVGIIAGRGITLRAQVGGNSVSEVGVTSFHSISLERGTAPRSLQSRGTWVRIRERGRSTSLDKFSRARIILGSRSLHPQDLPPILSVEDREGLYFHRFKEACFSGNVKGQLLNLRKLCTEYIGQDKFIHAAHMINAALRLVQFHHYSRQFQEMLFAKLHDIELRFLRKQIGIEIPVNPLNQVEYYREHLREIRNDLKRNLLNQSVKELQKALTEEFKLLLIKIIENAQSILGPAPTSFTVLGLGSMSRYEMSPYSDVEFAFLIADVQHKFYFRKLAQLLELKIINLGETQFNLIPSRKEGNQYIEARSLVPKGFSMDIGGLSPLGKQGVYELIGTPEELSVLQSTQWVKEHDAEIFVVNAMASPILLMGNEQLFLEYSERVSKLLNQPTGSRFRQLPEHKQRALRLLEGHVADFKPWLGEGRIEVRAFDAKRDLYRPFQIIIDTLALYFNIEEKNTEEQIAALVQLEVFSPEGGANIIKAMQQALRWRLEAQLFYQEEKEILLHAQDQEKQSFFTIGSDDTERLIQLYRIQTPFLEAANMFLSHQSKKCFAINMYDHQLGQSPMDGEKGISLAEIERRCFEMAALRYSDASFNNLANIQQELGKYDTALVRRQESLAIVKQKHGENSIEVANSLVQLGILYVELHKYSDAVSTYQEALRVLILATGDMPHLDKAACLTELGWAKFMEGYITPWEKSKFHDEAVSLNLQAQAMYKAICGTRPHLGLARCLMIQAQIKGFTPKDATSSLEEVIEIYEQLKKTNLLEARLAMAWLAEAYTNEEKYKNAIKIGLKVWKIQEQVGSDPSTPLSNLIARVLSKAYMGRKQFSQAILYLNKEREMFDQLIDNRPDEGKAKNLALLGLAHSMIGNIKESICYLEDAIKIFKQLTEGNPNPNPILDQITISLRIIWTQLTAKGEHECALTVALRRLNILQERWKERLKFVLVSSDFTDGVKCAVKSAKKCGMHELGLKLAQQWDPMGTLGIAKIAYKGLV